MNAPRTARYVGGRLTIAEAVRHAGAALLELGDLDLALELEETAKKIAARGREEDTREFPILPLAEKEPTT